MRVLMVNYEFPPIGGGAANANLHLLKEYAKETELEVDLVTSAPEPGFTETAFAENITLHKVGIRKQQLHYWRKAEVISWLLKAGPHYRRLVGAKRYDLAHAFFAFPSGWFPYREAARMPYIVSLRGSDVPGYNVRLGLDYKLLGGLFRRIWQRSAAVVANSQGLRDLALAFTPELEIGVIPNGIDTDTFHPDDRPRPARPLRLLTVCRLIERKRIDLLIQAVAQARELGLETELQIAGHGNLLDQLRQLSECLEVADRITFLGRVAAEDMPALYRANDLFLMSSAHEGMSNAMLEAMASGLPIVTTRCEGVDELVSDNGIVVDDAPAAIAKAINQILGRAETYERMAEGARLKAHEFSWAITADRYRQLYKRIL